MERYDHQKIDKKWPRKNSSTKNLTGQAGIYDHKRIDSKWQAYWEEEKLFEAKDFDKLPKQYILVEFPYPSGEGLHTGHCRSYTALDIIARKRRMEGFNVLYPIGWDAFGLPTENYAIKTGIHPAEATKKNTDTFRRQLKSIGFSFDWSREINTTEPKYYKWTQWIFLQLYKKGLAYKAKMPINFCPSCKIGLANEEVVNGKCERCGTEVTKKEMEQWMLAITKYADRLIDDLDKVDYLEKIKLQQINWIGRSEGVEIKFKITHLPNYSITVFTTRPDTLFGATYMVLSPEHELIVKLKSKIQNLPEVKRYINEAKRKSDIERTDEKKDKTGVELKGIKAINAINNAEIPIFIADYVLPNYGTGAIMAVPAHDHRDYEFAKKFDLPIVQVISRDIVVSQPYWPETDEKPKFDLEGIYDGPGHLINSGEFSGMISTTAAKKITEKLKKIGAGKFAVNYKLRDWIFSRQHYWGEPIPIIYCKKCGEVPVPENELPVELPMVEKYQPTETGESPLANIKDWVNTKCPKCGGKALRETDTMPNWAGSSWYYLAYVTLGNQKSKNKNQNKDNIFIDNRKEINYWMPVDLYNGGMEHTTLHLLYSRFWYKFLFDIGVVPNDEPYSKRTSQGMVLAEGGVKMSKSKGNVINPELVVKEEGADVLRLFEMFMGPFGQRIAWDTKGILGVRRFLDKVWQLFVCHSERSEESPGDPSSSTQDDKKPSRELLVKLNQTIKKVSDDIENFGFNTAVSALMEFVNEATSTRVEPSQIRLFLLILSPFAPHLCEELWNKLGYKGSTLAQRWPKVDAKYLTEEEMTIAIQVNGKLRDTMKIKTGSAEKEVIAAAKSSPNAKKYLAKNKIKKEIYIKGRLVNFVV